MQKQYRILSINPGSTSTKIAFFIDAQPVFVETVRHSTDELKKYEKITDQYEYRRQLILRTLANNAVEINELDAVVGRGGLIKPLASGTYRVNDAMCADLKIGVQGEHASNLGGLLARGIADTVGIPAFIVDPVCVDELEAVARITGLPEISRRSLVHALNLRAAALRATAELKRAVADTNLVLVHLGGGVSLAASKGGKMIDISNPNDEGAFSPERAGGLPMQEFMKMCMSGKFSVPQLKKKLVGTAGLVAHLGTSDGKEILHRINEGDKKAELIMNAMAYNIAKQVGALATVLFGAVNAIVLTGGLAHSAYLTSLIGERVNWIAPILLFPGEDEMQSLTEGALRVLRGEEPAQEY
ncbi:MAG: butyrate kinase [Negativicutes bacterium]